MRVLVTGAKGFIGRHLCALLRVRGHTVFEFDARTGDSVLNSTSLKNAMTGIDQVYHLAGIVGVKRTMQVPVKTFTVNSLGTVMVAFAAKEAGAKMFLASSSEVYGEGHEYLKLREHMGLRSHFDQRWVYAMSKVAAELMVQSILPEDQYLIGRFFNVVGPGQYPSSGMVLPRFIDQAIRGEDITVYGDGQQERCFGYVTEIVQAVYELMQNNSGIYNIAGTASCTISELARKVQDILASSSEIIREKGPRDAGRRIAEVSKLNASLRWVPSMNLGKIIQLTAGWWLTQMEKQNDRTSGG